MFAEEIEDEIGLAASTYAGYDLDHAAVHANLEAVEVFVVVDLHELLPGLLPDYDASGKNRQSDISVLLFNKTADNEVFGNRDAVQTGGCPALLSISTGFSREN